MTSRRDPAASRELREVSPLTRSRPCAPPAIDGVGSALSAGLAGFPVALFLAFGMACVVGGGLASAATAGGPSEHSAWAVAYLVLVAGVAQVGLGLGLLLAVRRSGVTALVELVCWNVGNACVLAGVLASVAVLVDVGGALLVVALALALHGVRRPRRGRTVRWPLWVFRVLAVILLVSIPAGLVLARV